MSESTGPNMTGDELTGLKTFVYNFKIIHSVAKAEMILALYWLGWMNMTLTPYKKYDILINLLQVLGIRYFQRPYASYHRWVLSFTLI